MGGVGKVVCILLLGQVAIAHAQQAEDTNSETEAPREQVEARVKAKKRTTATAVENQQQAKKPAPAPEINAQGIQPQKQTPTEPRANESKRPNEPHAKAPAPDAEPTPEPEAVAKPTRTPTSEPEPTSGITPGTRAESEQNQQRHLQQAAPKRLKPAKPRVDRSGSFIGNSQLPPMPQLTFNGTAEQNRDESEAPYEPGELLVSSPDMTSAIKVAGQLRALDLTVKSRQQFKTLGLVLTRFRLPAQLPTRTALSHIRQQFPALDIDTNQRYHIQAGARKTWAHTMVAWPQAQSNCLQGKTPVLGMLDTAVNLQHPALRGRSITVENFVEGKPADSTHATAIASLLLADSESGFNGLLPSAKLFAANVFRLRGKHKETTTSALLPALEWLANHKVTVINLSFGGQHNRIFAQAIAHLSQQGVAMVAAAGNGGPEAPHVYPAAQQEVIAVSAIDAAGHIYTNANRGDYIDFVAPGVNVWAADGEQGGRYHSGTSFAAPFVSARLALANNQLQPLIDEAEDSGETGKDAVYGWGVIQGPKKCRLE